MSIDTCANNSCQSSRSRTSRFCGPCLEAANVAHELDKRRADVALARMLGAPEPEPEPESVPVISPTLEQSHARARKQAEATGGCITGGSMGRRARAIAFNNGQIDRVAASHAVPAPYNPRPSGGSRTTVISSEPYIIHVGMTVGVVVETYERVKALRFSIWLPKAQDAFDSNALGLIRILYRGSNTGVNTPHKSGGSPASLYAQLAHLPGQPIFDASDSLVFELHNNDLCLNREVAVAVEVEPMGRLGCG